MWLVILLLVVVLLILTKVIEPFSSYMLDLDDAQAYTLLTLAWVLYLGLWLTLYLLVRPYFL